MSTLINIAVDLTLSTAWWVVRKTGYGIYSGVHYLVYGNAETQTDIERRQLLQRLENQDKLLIQLNQKLDIMEKGTEFNGIKPNQDCYIIPNKTSELPPPYQEINHDYDIIDNTTIY